MPVCQLCRNEVQSFVESHIVPASFYRTLGRPGDAGVILGNAERDTRSRTGIYRRFLCSECEKKFEACDNYACTLLRDAQPDEEHRHGNGALHYFVYHNVDYRLLKLFIISVLWRAHASPKRTPIFGGVQLPHEVAEQFRDILLAGSTSSLPPDDFPVFVGKSNQPVAYVVREPKFVTIDEMAFVNVYVPGYVFLIQIEKGPIPKSIFLFLLHPGTGLTAWHHDHVACGEAEEAAAVYLASRTRRINEVSRRP